MRVTTSSLLWLVGNSNAVNPCPPLPGTDGGSDWCQTEFRSAVGISSKSFIKVHHLPLHLILLVTKFRLETDENSCLFFCKTVILHLEFSMCLLMLYKVVEGGGHCLVCVQNTLTLVPHGQAQLVKVSPGEMLDGKQINVLSHEIYSVEKAERQHSTDHQDNTRPHTLLAG